MQLIYNVQRAKGTAPVIVQDSRKPINVTGEFDQWNDVTVTYTDAQGDVADRNAIGFGRTPYTNTSGRNDIVSAKVTSDTKNLYFYVSTVYDISMFDTDSSWMQLYLNVDGRDAETGETGWYGYDFIINYQAKSEFTTTVAKYNGTDGAFSFETVGEVSYRAKDNEMMIAVPLEMLGVEHCDYMNFHFKWVDSDSKMTTMEQFYTEGDVAPLGRLNYVFNTVMPGSVPPEEVETEAPAETPAETPTEGDVTEGTAPAESTDGDTETDAPKKGCGSSLLTSAAAILAASAAAVAVSKKKENE
jgi:hypothetical protein